MCYNGKKTFVDTENLVCSCDEVHYELRTIVLCSNITSIQYDACVYSRHGGRYTRWWLQERKHSISSYPIQIDYDLLFESRWQMSSCLYQTTELFFESNQ